jgi:hypothetical protein
MVASKAVLEEQPAKECAKLTAKVKTLKKRKKEVNVLLLDLLESSRESQFQHDEYEMASDRQSFLVVCVCITMQTGNVCCLWV